MRCNLEKHLVYRILNPLLLFNKNGRTESAIKHYQKFLFHDATFADLIRRKRPTFIVDAFGHGDGIRFSFIQACFDLLCSKLAAYPGLWAVTDVMAIDADRVRIFQVENNPVFQEFLTQINGHSLEK